jgi:hypothetical protein
MKLKSHDSYEHHYKNWYGSEAKCLVDVFFLENPTRPEGIKTIVLFSELQDNMGTSITNMSETIAEEILKKYNLKLQETMFIETYPYNYDRLGEFYDRVEYDMNEINKLCNIRWSPLKDSGKKFYDFVKNNKAEYPLDRAY